MGFLSGSLKVASNVLTLGGASRLEDAKIIYQETFNEHEQLNQETKSYLEKISEQVSTIGNFLKSTKPLLKKSEKILKKSTSNRSKLSFKFTPKKLNRINKFNSEYNAAIGIGTGTVAGGSLAVGSWALVGALGSASTGAAISGLSGVAATNATMAWFGGGALTAGGAGMAGGMAVLGGLVAVPLICIASIGTHKKAKEFEEEIVKLDAAILEQKKHLATLPETLKSVEDKKLEIQDVCGTFSFQCNSLIKIIRPYGIFSAIKQKIFLFLRLRHLNVKQVDALNELDKAISDFINFFQAGTTENSDVNIENNLISLEKI